MKYKFISFYIFIFTTVSFSQYFNADIEFRNTSIIPGVAIKGTDSSYFSFQTNLFPFTILHRDEYNDTPSKVSVYPAYRGAFILGMGFISMGFSDSSLVKGIIRNVMIPCFVLGALTTSQVHLNIYGFDTLNYSPFRSSTFIGTQTDFFQGKKVNWWKFSLDVGVELLFVFKKEYLKNKIYPSNAIGIQFGIVYQWDYVKSFISKPNEFFVTTKYYF